MLFNIDLPPEFWDYTIEYIIYIKNYVPIAALLFRNITIIIPYKVLYGVEVNLKSIKAFSYLAWLINTKELKPEKSATRHKLDWMFIGIKGESIYILFNLLIKAVKPFSNIGFNEYEFPYCEFQQNANLPFKSRVLLYIKKRIPYIIYTKRRRRDCEESSDLDSASLYNYN